LETKLEADQEVMEAIQEEMKANQGKLLGGEGGEMKATMRAGQGKMQVAINSILSEYGETVKCLASADPGPQ
jgi:hypothetical protein